MGPVQKNQSNSDHSHSEELNTQVGAVNVRHTPGIHIVHVCLTVQEISGLAP